MITKTDLILLLTELQDTGVSVEKELINVMKNPTISLDILKFIEEKRPLDVGKFYSMLRKNYNSKKSKLYVNLVKDELKDPTEVLTTLASLNLQILLFADKLEDDRMFLNHARGEEITRVLNNYYKTYDLTPCLKLLKLVKADILAFEFVQNRRDENGKVIL